MLSPHRDRRPGRLWVQSGAFSAKALREPVAFPKQSLYTISQTVGFVLFEKIPANQLFNKSKKYRSY